MRLGRVKHAAPVTSAGMSLDEAAGRYWHEAGQHDAGAKNTERDLARALRYFNAAGADPDGDIGELHQPETHLIPLVLFAAMGREPSIKIFGNDYRTPDGTCIRDYVHVSDLADAHVAAIEWLAAGHPSNSFNLGNGLGFSVAEVVRTTEKVTGLSVRTEMCPRRLGDPPVLVSDSTKARELLGWIPKIPGLDQQITHAWTWFHDKMPNV